MINRTDVRCEWVNFFREQLNKDKTIKGALYEEILTGLVYCYDEGAFDDLHSYEMDVLYIWAFIVGYKCHIQKDKILKKYNVDKWLKGGCNL